MFGSNRNYEYLPSSRRAKVISVYSHASHFLLDFVYQVSIDNEAAYGLVLQREISLFRDSRDGVDIEIGTVAKSMHWGAIYVAFYPPIYRINSSACYAVSIV